MGMRLKSLALLAVFAVLLVGEAGAVDDYDHLLNPDPTCPICHTQKIPVLDTPLVEPLHVFLGSFHPLKNLPHKTRSQIPEIHNFIRGPPLAD